MSVFSACSVFGHTDASTPPYKSIQQDDIFEVRLYERLILATTPISSSEGRNDAFYRLFQYISGQNEAAQKIEMTAPVLMDMGSEGQMSFILPERYDTRTAPLARNGQVQLEQMENFKVAVVTFYGLLNESNVIAHKELLQEWMDEKGLVAAGPYRAAGYNPPFTLPLLRRNEVMIPVK